jgi:DNA-binding NarL/FixJ family response regulator
VTGSGAAPAQELRHILLVEDEDIVRSEVSIFFETPPLEINVTACGDVASAVRAITSPARFDVALVDLGLPDGTGIDVIHGLRHERPACPIVVFTIHGDADTLFEALRAGACGYLLKQTPPERLHAALLDALAGGAPMSPTVARLVVASFSTNETPGAQLTARERELLALLGRGHSYGDIAKALGIGLGTVQGYVKAVYKKLEISSKAEAAACAARLGLV